MDEITVEFRVCKDEMDLALAKITSALELNGVKRINSEAIKDQTTFKIFGETDEAVRKARSMLEFGDPKSIQILGNLSDKIIDEIKEKSRPIVRENGVVPVKVLMYTHTEIQTFGDTVDTVVQWRIS